MHCRIIDSPVGRLRLVSDGEHLVAIEMDVEGDTPSSSGESADPVLDDCAAQLGEYFAGDRDHFDLPLAQGGTEFQQAVWRALAAIPYGEVRSYGEIAEAIGKPTAVRAVGAANGANPLPIVVPCHRVIGSNGSLTGFSAGIDIKRQLLALEGSLPE